MSEPTDEQVKRAEKAYVDDMELGYSRTDSIRSALYAAALSHVQAPAEEGYDCEDCIGMREHGCYCANMGAKTPGGPIPDAPQGRVAYGRFYTTGVMFDWTNSTSEADEWQDAGWTVKPLYTSPAPQVAKGDDRND